jgi:hypothetical protein
MQQVITKAHRSDIEMTFSIEDSINGTSRTGVADPSQTWRHGVRGRFPAPISAARAVLFLVCVLLLCSAGKARAQQLEPRAYSLSPVGTNFFGTACFYQSGGAVLDPSLPIENVQARVQTAIPFYGRTFGLFGRLASLSVLAPFAYAVVEGDVQEARKSVDRTGFGDPAMRLAVNLFGGPALTPKEFRAFKQGTTLGTSLTVFAPFGQYDPAKLINLGTNRWAFRPELGLSHPLGPWDLELSAGVWLFTDNNDFFGGKVRRQDPLLSLQTHIVYTIRPRMWAAVDFIYYGGGSTTVDGQSKNDRQDNTRGGLTLAVPVTAHQSLKLSWSRGVSTRVGTAFETFGVAWQVFWY